MTKQELDKEIRNRVEETMDFLRMCGMTGLTEAAKRNAWDWLINNFKIFYQMGNKDGFKEGYEMMADAWQKSINKI